MDEIVDHIASKRYRDIYSVCKLALKEGETHSLEGARRSEIIEEINHFYD